MAISTLLFVVGYNKVVHLRYMHSDSIHSQCQSMAVDNVEVRYVGDIGIVWRNKTQKEMILLRKQDWKK